MSSEQVTERPHKHGLAHAVWVALAAVICLFLTLTKQTGHPPPITLVPLGIGAYPRAEPGLADRPPARPRRPGLLSAMLSVGWALLLVKQIAGQLGMADATDTVGVLIAAGLIVLLLLIAAYLGWSRKVRSFLVR